MAGTKASLLTVSIVCAVPVPCMNLAPLLRRGQAAISRYSPRAENHEPNEIRRYSMVLAGTM
jgi:hypothetical protein